MKFSILAVCSPLFSPRWSYSLWHGAWYGEPLWRLLDRSSLGIQSPVRSGDSAGGRIACKK